MSDTPNDPNEGVPSDGDLEAADEIASLSTRINQARELVASGHEIDLQGLNEQVGAFCAALAANPPDDADSITRMIEALVTDLGLLAQEMADRHAAGALGAAPRGGSGSGGGNGGAAA